MHVFIPGWSSTRLNKEHLLEMSIVHAIHFNNMNPSTRVKTSFVIAVSIGAAENKLLHFLPWFIYLAISDTDPMSFSFLGSFWYTWAPYQIDTSFPLRAVLHQKPKRGFASNNFHMAFFAARLPCTLCTWKIYYKRKHLLQFSSCFCCLFTKESATSSMRRIFWYHSARTSNKNQAAPLSLSKEASNFLKIFTFANVGGGEIVEKAQFSSYTLSWKFQQQCIWGQFAYHYVEDQVFPILEHQLQKENHVIYTCLIWICCRNRLYHPFGHSEKIRNKSKRATENRTTMNSLNWKVILIATLFRAAKQK